MTPTVKNPDPSKLLTKKTAFVSVIGLRKLSLITGSVSGGGCETIYLSSVTLGRNSANYSGVSYNGDVITVNPL